MKKINGLFCKDNGGDPNEEASEEEGPGVTEDELQADWDDAQNGGVIVEIEYEK